MRKTSYLSLLLMVSIALFSCERTCTQGEIYFHFSGFDSTELSRVIVKKYSKGAGFETALTTEEKHIDSLNSSIPSSIEYDWMLELPLAGKSYKVSDIAYKGDKDGEKSPIRTGERDACTDGLNYNINGNAAESVTNFGNVSSQPIKIKK